MKRLLLFLLFLIGGIAETPAQLGSFDDVPIDISGEVGFEGGIAFVRADQGDVRIGYGDVTIYCEYAQYNPDTRDVFVQGNVRIYREGRLFTADRALYNLETKVLNASAFRGDVAPFRFGGDSLSSQTGNAYLAKEGLFTTSDSSKPDYQLRAKSIRVYPNDRIIFSRVTLYIGRTPVFWFPYLYQSLNKEQGFTITPGYSSVWGAYLLGQYTFPLSENTSGKVRLDLLSDRGIGLGFESEWETGRAEPRAATSSSVISLAPTQRDEDERPRTERKRGRNWGRFRSYVIEDAQPGLNRTGLTREAIDPTRYRSSLQDRTYLTDDIYSTIDINKLSDRRFLQDFAEGEFRQNPNPDNVFALTKWNEDYTLTLIARKQLNEQFDLTERLPELALDIKRQPLFKTPFFYESESSLGVLRRNFADLSAFPDYNTFRADTFHQILYPQTYFGWLSVVPRIGARATYYTDSGTFDTVLNEREIEETETDPNSGKVAIDPTTGLPRTRRRTISESEEVLRRGGSLFRPVVNAGVEASFKLSRAYEQVQSRMWGLDGLRHVVQPFANASFVYSGEDPLNVLQFDRLNRSTQLPPIDFPQFNTIDSIDDWSIFRLGVRNRLQTRRDNLTFSWLELNTYLDVNLDRPGYGSRVPLADPGTFSNLFNRLRWVPVPWVNLLVDSQIPLLDAGFTEVNTSVNFLVNRAVQFNLGHRYINGNTQFLDSNLLNLGAYFRMGDNWGFSFREQFEFEDSVLEAQRYELHRDLSSWVASLGFLVRDNRGVNDYGVLLTFTLKDIPGVRIPLALDPTGNVGGGSGKNR